MDLSNLILLVLLTSSLSYVFAYPSDIRLSSESETDDRPEWLNDLESQIYTDEELPSFLSPKRESVPVKSIQQPKKVIGEGDYDKEDLIEEDLVITERPYLLGPDHEDSQTTTNPVEAETEEHELGDESSTDLISDDSVANGTTVSPSTNEGEKSTTDRKVNSTALSDVDYLLTTSTEMVVVNITYGYDYSPTTDEDIIIFSRSYERYNSYHVLDKILSDIQPISKPTNSDGVKKSSSMNEDNSISRSEVKSFVVLVVNQTWFILIGCILSIVILCALMFAIHTLRKKLNDRSAITLIAHNDYSGNEDLKN